MYLDLKWQFLTSVVLFNTSESELEKSNSEINKLLEKYT